MDSLHSGEEFPGQVTKVKASRVLPRLGLVKPDCPVSWVQLRPGPGLLLLLVLRLLQIGLLVALE